jgi:hypothetical protein
LKLGVTFYEMIKIVLFVHGLRRSPVMSVGTKIMYASHKQL